MNGNDPEFAVPINVEPEADASSPDTVYHLVIFQNHRDDNSLRTISRPLARLVRRLLDDEIDTPPDRTQIDVWIDSPGGDAHAAYKLVLDLRSRAHHVRAVVPDFAKSAATLMALGMDEILMAPAAELGPLDIQIPHPDRENEMISGLDAVGSLTFLTTTAVEMVLAGGSAFVKITELPRIDILRETLQFMAGFMQPVVCKLDPHLLHRAANQLRVAEKYAVTMLRNRQLAPEEHLSAAKAKTLLQKLVNDYPIHGYIISRDEARELGLPIRSAEEHPRWDIMQALHQQAYKEPEALIVVLRDTKLDSDAEGLPEETLLDEDLSEEFSDTEAGTE